MLRHARRSEPTTIWIEQTDPALKHVQKVPIRAGTLVIWDGRLIHSNFPNTGEKPRYVQYVKMNAVGPDIQSCVEPLYESEDEFRDYVKEEDFEMTPLGRKLFGFDPWY